MLPITLLNVIASPVIARLYSLRDMDELQHVLSGVALAMTAGVALLSAPLLIAGQMLLGLAFGPQFEAANSTLVILCLGYTAATALGPVAIYMNMTGREKHVTRTCGIALVVNFLVALALVPTLGSKGAAIATVSGYFSWCALLLFLVYREDRLNPTIFGFWSRRHPDQDGALSI
jgi:O-antigen/teichoic acid export membrane protein